MIRELAQYGGIILFCAGGLVMTGGYIVSFVSGAWNRRNRWIAFGAQLVSIGILIVLLTAAFE